MAFVFVPWAVPACRSLRRLPWLPIPLLFVACMAATWATGYVVHDADSGLYAALTAELAAQPLWRWCVPVWGGHWGRHGPFLEHPPGLFWAGAVCVRLGMSGSQALYALNFASWLSGLILLWRLGCQLACRQTALLALLLWIMCPAFIQYLIRGDQENPLTWAFLFGLVAATARWSPWAVGAQWGVACIVALLCKGLPACALLPIGFGLGLMQRRQGVWWWAMTCGTLTAGLVAWGFDRWVSTQTGHSFWVAYGSGQVAHSLGHSGWGAHKAVNGLYYLARPLWFAAPGVGVAGWALWRRCTTGARLGGVTWALGVGMLGLFICAFSLADRKADRYLFAAYPMLCLSAAGAAVTQGTKLQRQAAALLEHPYALMWRGVGVIFVVVLLKIYVGTYHYVFVRLWPGA